MIPASHFLIDHPVGMLVTSILCGQLGLPVPAVPSLLLIGSLASMGRSNLTLSICVILATCLAADTVAYEIGRSRASRHAHTMSPARRSTFWTLRITELFGRHQVVAVSLTRFLPGPNIVSALAGFSGMPRTRFLLLDAITSLLWAGGYIATGYLFRAQLEDVIISVSRWSGVWSAVFLLSALAVNAAVQRHRRGLPLQHRFATRATTAICLEASLVCAQPVSISRGIPSEQATCEAPPLGLRDDRARTMRHSLSVVENVQNAKLTHGQRVDALSTLVCKRRITALPPGHIRWRPLACPLRHARRDSRD